MVNKELPEWATAGGVNNKNWAIIHVDSDKMYPAWLEEIGVVEVTQYWLEVCFQCMKLELQTLLPGVGFEVRLKAKDKEKWRQGNYPKGTCCELHNRNMGAVEAATKGKEARNHFRRLRGYLPAGVSINVSGALPKTKPLPKAKNA